MKYISFLQEGVQETRNILKINELLYFLHEFRKLINNNIAISSQYNQIIHNLLLILQYNELLKEKEALSRELELSSKYKKSSEIAASKDLMIKLNESLTLNMKKLEFFEEDYIQHKNQIDQIKNTLEAYDSTIHKLTEQKKQCFSQINRITREMSGETQNSKNELKINIIDSTNNLSNAEKIRAYQKKAKEIQNDINDIKSKKSQTELKLEELTPIFEILERDHQALLEIIDIDKNRIEDLKSELKNKIKDENTAEIQDIDLIDAKTLRSSRDIMKDLEKISIELNNIILPENSLNPQNPYDLSLIIEKLTQFYETINNNKSEILINIDGKEISNSINKFTELEYSLTNIETLLNKFLLEINIKSQIRIFLSDDQKDFFINIKFLRKDTEDITFEELTTPEKIFFIIVFYISIKLHINQNNIIFSNVSILNQFNKAGSIYRTIRKIIPIFDSEKSLSKFNLIFILSNLELKKEIKNLNVKTIKES